MAGKRIVVLSLFALVALTLAVFSATSTQAQTYKPQITYSLSTSTGGADSTSTLNVTIPAPNYNYEDSSMYNFAPIDGWITPGNMIPVGAKMGNLSSTAVLGLNNQKCWSTAPAIFDLYNATVDTSTVLTKAEMAWTNTDNTVPYGARGLVNVPDYLEAYPLFLNQMLDPDGPAGILPPLKPRARYAGHYPVAGSNMLIETVVLNPGEIKQLGGIKAQMGDQLGFVLLTILNNPWDQTEKPGTVSDFCAPMASTTILLGTTQAGYNGVGGGISSQRNGAANTGVLNTGTGINRNYSQSERDADGDGIENDLDPCPHTLDATWNPRTANPPMPPCSPGAIPGDDDCDGLPNSCDPNDGDGNQDADNDVYNNRQDICPLVADGQALNNQSDTDSTVQALNADLGPGPDSIGDACDDSDCDGVEDLAVTPCSCADGKDNGGVDGLVDGNDSDCTSSMDLLDPTPWGTTPGTGLFYHGLAPGAACVGATSTDNDGYCDILEGVLGSSTTNGSESDGSVNGGDNCKPPDADDDDGDGYVNDGCPMIGRYSEDPAKGECAIGNNTNDDTADTAETTATFNDGCPVIGVPESLVVDATINATGGLPSAIAPQSCTDGLDNDADTLVDANDVACQKASISGDTDYDGWANDPAVGFDADITPANAGNETYKGDPAQALGSWSRTGANVLIGTNAGQCWIVGPGDEDLAAGGTRDNELEAQLFCYGEPLGLWLAINIDGDTDPDIMIWKVFPAEVDPTGQDNCTTVWNPEQTNTDGDTEGDACDLDDDGDGYADSIEWYLGTDPVDNCANVAPTLPCPGLTCNGHDAWPLDINVDKFATVAGDVYAFAGNIGLSVSGTPPTTWSLARLDLNKDNYLTVAGDVYQFAGNVGLGCT